MRRILTIADISDESIDVILARARAHLGAATHPEGPSRIVGLAFVEPSLRTRVGFAAAAARLGWQPLSVLDRRTSQHGGPPEGLRDTVRAVCGYVDVLVLRQPGPIQQLIGWVPESVTLLNGGDGGDQAEHPSQALIDLFAVQQLSGPLDQTSVVVCGDLSMRSCRSLLRLFKRRPPKSLQVVATPETAPLFHGPTWGSLLEVPDLGGVDVLYTVGMPHGVPEPVRRRLRVDRRALDALPPTAVVLNPMPVIDEIAASARPDPRIRMFDQSDLGLPVRAALLEWLVGHLG